MSKKTRAERNLKFETLQLHVGQENPDPATGARAVPGDYPGNGGCLSGDGCPDPGGGG